MILGFLYVYFEQRRDFHTLKREVNVGIFECFRLDQSDGGGHNKVATIGIKGRKGGCIGSTGIEDMLALNVAGKEVKHF